MRIICALCLGNIFGAGVEESASSLPCGHVLHSRCVQNWFGDFWRATTAPCPKCRRAIQRNRVVRLFLDLRVIPNRENDIEAYSFVIEYLAKLLREKEDEVMTEQRKFEEKEDDNLQLRRTVDELQEKLTAAHLLLSELQKKSEEIERVTNAMVLSFKRRLNMGNME